MNKKFTKDGIPFLSTRNKKDGRGFFYDPKTMSFECFNDNSNCPIIIVGQEDIEQYCHRHKCNKIDVFIKIISDRNANK